MSFVETYIAHEKAFSRIGASRARQLYEEHGHTLVEALLSGSALLSKLLGSNHAFDLTQVAAENVGALHFARELDELNICDLVTASEIMPVIQAHKALNPGALREDPFILGSVLEWRVNKKIALRLGIDLADPRFVLAAIDEELRQILSRGHTCTESAPILDGARKRLGLSEVLPDTIMDDAVATGLAVRLGHYVQPAGAAWMEAETALKLLKMADSAPCSNLEYILPELPEISQVIEYCFSQLPFALTGMQREAVYAAHSHRFMCLGGYAGSGKTTALEAICDTAEALGRRPRIITLSGRAAQRATEATGRQAMTIARFLMDGGPLGVRDLLIIDEASMVALPEIWRILQKIGDASLIMCGDPAQLPPISFGLVFHVLIDMHDIPSVLLDRVMRQDEATGIPTVAEGIRHGRLPALPSYRGIQNGVSFIPTKPSETIGILEEIRRDVNTAGLGRGDLQIIGAIKAGYAGVDTINRHFHEEALSIGWEAWPRYGHICAGEPFIFKKNDFERGLTNGSMGYVKGFEVSSVLVEVDGREDRLRPNDWSNVDLAHAITVHKSQGSQWDIVVIPVFDSFILDRALVYTALTRSKTQVVFVGNWRALCRAVEAEPKANDRVIGLAHWMALVNHST